MFDYEFILGELELFLFSSLSKTNSELSSKQQPKRHIWINSDHWVSQTPSKELLVFGAVV